MLSVIGFLFGGIALGYLFRKVKAMQKLDTPIFLTIILLLFFMGISVGSNKELLTRLHTVGIHAVVMAVATTAGSVLAVTLVYRLFFSKKKNDER